MNGVNFDQLWDVLQKALTVAAGLPGLPGMIFMAIILVAVAFIIIAKYFYDRNAREAAAFALNQKIQAEAILRLERVQSDASKGICANMEAAYKLDFTFMVEKIKNKDYAPIFPKIASVFYDKISEFIYREDLTPEDRAGRVILTIRPIK